MSGAASEYLRIREALDEEWSLRRKLRLVLEILPVYVRARWLLARREFPAVLAVLREVRKPTELSELDQQLLGVRLGRALERTLRPLPADSRCLIKSLVLTNLLARRGVDTQFIIGVRWAPDFQAHAWVEKAGVALLDTGDDQYQRLAEL